MTKHRLRPSAISWTYLNAPRRAGFFLALFFAALPYLANADEVEMQNGDRYVGKVLSLTNDTLVLQSDLLGELSLPRSKVTLIALGAGASTNLARLSSAGNFQVRAAAVVRTNGNRSIAADLRGLGANTNFIQQVKSQFLAAAGPEANSKFDEMVGGLLNGKLDLNDIRKEAKSAADQLRSLKKELGDDAGDSLDGYLDILDSFLKESAPATESSTNAIGSPPKPPVKSTTD